MIAALPAGSATVAVWLRTETGVDRGGRKVPCGPTCCPPSVMSVVADRPAEDEVVSAVSRPDRKLPPRLSVTVVAPYWRPPPQRRCVCV
jgi:hypothetical protein